MRPFLFVAPIIILVLGWIYWPPPPQAPPPGPQKALPPQLPRPIKAPGPTPPRAPSEASSDHPSPRPQPSSPQKGPQAIESILKERSPEQRLRIHHFTYVLDEEVMAIPPGRTVPQGANIIGHEGPWTWIDQKNPGKFPLSLVNHETRQRAIMTGTVIVRSGNPEVTDILEAQLPLAHSGSAAHLGAYFFSIEEQENPLENFPQNLERFIQRVRRIPEVDEANYEVLEMLVIPQ